MYDVTFALPPGEETPRAYAACSRCGAYVPVGTVRGGVCNNCREAAYQARPRITPAQARVIADLHRRYGAEATFAPLEAYPGRSNGDNGSRRVIAGLVQRGYVERVEVGDAGRPCIVEGGKCYRLRLAATAMEAIENGPR